MSSFPYVIPYSLRRFVRLSVPPSLPTKNGISKWTGRYVKLDLLTFHFAGLQLVYRNFCCELYFRSSPMLLFFASDSPLLPLSSRWFSVWHCRSHRWDAMLSYFTQSRVWKVQMEHWHIPFSRANKTHSQCYTLLWRMFFFFSNCDFRPILLA